MFARDGRALPGMGQKHIGHLEHVLHHLTPCGACGGNGRVHIFDRKSLAEVGAFGRIGRYAGQFIFMHNLASDSRGHLYVSEVGNGRRVQKFVLQPR